MTDPAYAKPDRAFWLRMAGLMLTVTTLVGSSIMGAAKWYVDDKVNDAVHDHATQAATEMAEKVESWWNMRHTQLRDEWRIEIKTALLEHVSIGPNPMVLSDLRSLSGTVHEVERRVVRIETKLDQLKANGGDFP